MLNEIVILHRNVNFLLNFSDFYIWSNFYCKFFQTDTWFQA